jgi:hypothetical protein
VVNQYLTEAPPAKLLKTLAISYAPAPFPNNPAGVRGQCFLLFRAHGWQQGLLWAHITTSLDPLDVQGLTAFIGVNTVERCEINDPDPPPSCADISR